MLMITGQVLDSFALAGVVLLLLASHPPLDAAIRPGHIRDVGAMLLTVVVVWAYLAFAQYLIVWSGNLPREVVWYLIRFRQGWLWVGLLAVFLRFILPFAVLLSGRTKRDPRVLAGAGVAILAGGLLDAYWQVAPVFHPGGLTVHWLDLAVPLGMGGLWLAAYTWLLKWTPQVFLPEPRAETRMEAASDQVVQ
jgi:hypothetical protein